MLRGFVLLLLLPVGAGCLYYAYPTISHVPPLAVENRDGSVHAFRVDIDKTDRKPLPPLTQYTLSSIPIDSRGLIPSQLEVAPATGVYNPLGVVEGGQHERSQFTMLVRVYRPGYQIIEVKAWEKSRELQWFPAADLAGQEKAIDDLLVDPAAPIAPRGPELSLGRVSADRSLCWWDQKDQKTPPLGLQPGAVSVSQRKALEFAAGEYQRLAGSIAAAGPSMQPVRERLGQKARWLQNYATQPAVQ
jgi:hypothetical protein